MDCGDCGNGPMVPMHRWKPGDVRDAGRGIYPSANRHGEAGKPAAEARAGANRPKGNARETA